MANRQNKIKSNSDTKKRTITDLFNRQRQQQQTRDCEVIILSDDEDVEHISPYFKTLSSQGNNSPCNGQVKDIRRCLSLKRKVTHTDEIVQGHSKVTLTEEIVQGHNKVTHTEEIVQGHNKVTHTVEIVQGHNKVTHTEDMVQGHSKVTHTEDMVQGHSKVTHTEEIPEGHSKVNLSEEIPQGHCSPMVCSENVLSKLDQQRQWKLGTTTEREKRQASSGTTIEGEKSQECVDNNKLQIFQDTLRNSLVTCTQNNHESINRTTGVTGDLSTGVTGELCTGVTSELSTGVTSELCTGVTSELSTGVTGELSTGVTGELSTGQTGETGDDGTPYYLANFELIVGQVMKDDFYSYLFNDFDLSIVSIFSSLSDETRKLYIRLLSRNYRWLTREKIVYQKIAHDLDPYLQDLVRVGLLEDQTALTDLQEALTTLPAAGLKTVAKSLHLNPSQPMKALLTAINQHVHKHSATGAFFQHASSMRAAILRRVKDIVGHCYRLKSDARDVFLRVIMLFGLHQTRGEDENHGLAQTLLFQMLMSDMGVMKFPDYKVYRTTRIFQDRQSLIKFNEALQLELRLAAAVDKKRWTDALDLHQTAMTLYHQHLGSKDYQYECTVVPCLRVFCPGSVYTRCLSYGVEVLESVRRYEDAVDVLSTLLGQHVHNMNYRGRWYERLALNTDHHLKKHDQALDIISRGLLDSSVRCGRRLALVQRAEKICKTLRHRWGQFEHDPMSRTPTPPTMLVQWRVLSHGLYIKEDSRSPDGFTILKRVEDVVLEHCQTIGYPQGIHGEGGTFAFFLTLYFYDIIFCDDIPDVFYNLYQTQPLDFYHQDFYRNRKPAIDQRLEHIASATPQELMTRLDDLYLRLKDTVCTGLNWSLFPDSAAAQGLVSCMQGRQLAAILERMIKDVRFTRGGLPDLVVWNTTTKQWKVIEVKGPGDRLSTKQILWINYMIDHRIDACVCHVQAVDARRL